MASKQPSGAQNRQKAAAKAATLAAIGLTPEQIRAVSALRLGAPAAAPEPRARAAEDAPPSCALPQLVPPPLAAGVASCEAWIATLAAQAAASPEMDEELGRALRRCVQTAGKLKDKAARSEKAVKLLALREGRHLDTRGEQPPPDVVALPCWAFFRACAAAYAVAQGDTRAAGTQLDMIAATGYVPCNGAIKDLTRRLAKPPAKG